jgi:hypothetical protein
MGKLLKPFAGFIFHLQVCIVHVRHIPLELRSEMTAIQIKVSHEGIPVLTIIHLLEGQLS